MSKLDTIFSKSLLLHQKSITLLRNTEKGKQTDKIQQSHHHERLQTKGKLQTNTLTAKTSEALRPPREKNR